jgi:hypothetical protein
VERAVLMANGAARVGVTSRSHGDVALVASAGEGNEGARVQSRLMARRARRRHHVPARRARGLALGFGGGGGTGGIWAKIEGVVWARVGPE